MKIIKIYEDKGHVEFDCGDGVIQKNQDLFADTAEGIQENVAKYCLLYNESVKSPLDSKEVTKMRAVEGKAIPAEVIDAVTLAVAEVPVETSVEKVTE